jgi:hypothetical protein
VVGVPHGLTFLSAVQVASAGPPPRTKFVEPWRLEILDQVLTLKPVEVFDLDPNAAAECRTVLFAALRTVAVQWA